tara:strand:- start:527 stop:652 length:126 start_codon:yes stop_codon:yes gene_type:complete
MSKKLPDFSKEFDWIKLKFDMGIELTRKEEKILNKKIKGSK